MSAKCLLKQVTGQYQVKVRSNVKIAAFFLAGYGAQMTGLNLRPSGGGAYVTTLSRFLRITKKPWRVAPRRLA